MYITSNNFPIHPLKEKNIFQLVELMKILKETFKDQRKDQYFTNL